MASTPQPWMARVTSSCSSDTNPTFLITFPDAKYLFNCPENTTRNVLQRGFGLNKYRAIFLSRITTRTSLGLPGFLMTLADSGTKTLKVHGPPGLSHFLASSRHFLNRETLRLEASETDVEDLDPVFKDENLTVYAIPIPLEGEQSDLKEQTPSPERSPSLKRSRSMSPEGAPLAKRLSRDGDTAQGSSSSKMKWTNPVAWRKLIVDRMFPGESGTKFHAQNSGPSAWELKQRLPRWSHRHFATSYFVVGPEYRGKFNATLAESLGVPRGPLRAKLARGESITLPDGKVITPEMIIGESSSAAALLVIDCPSVGAISSLLASPTLSKLVSRERQLLHCVFHMAPDNVMRDPSYIKWMKSLGKDIHHIVANDSVCSDGITFSSSAAMQEKLSELDGELFRRPHFNDSSQESYLQDLGMGDRVLAAKQQVIGMRPLVPPCDSYTEGTNIDPQDSLLPQSSIQSVFSGVKEKILSELPSPIPSRGDDVSISLLGTGSAVPGKYRNVSGALVQIPGFGNILLDCGEGTYGQLRRHFGPQIDTVLREIKLVFLSHIHADHHLGISQLLVERCKLFPPTEYPITLIGPFYSRLYLSEYADIESLGIKTINGVHFLSAEDLEHRRPLKHDTTDIILTYNSVKLRLGLADLRTAAVDHRTTAFGIVLRHVDGWSITYSGDTRPCQNLVDAGMDSTLLIHEATMSDEQEVMAKDKGHSTIGQAVDIACRMKAKKLLLTHFSTRYPKIPVLGRTFTGQGEEAVTLPEIFVGFDHLHIRLGDFSRAERYIPNLENAFSEIKEDIEPKVDSLV
ncbi:hypothetical protein FRC15_003245 [Serendipita sp. 397]|nr:hypothetical protein FRC15_003245 [Serendipita sp. 397]